MAQVINGLVDILPTEEPRSTYKADFAKYLVRQDVLREIANIVWDHRTKEFVEPGRYTGMNLPRKANLAVPTPKDGEPLPLPVKPLKVGIVGGGIAGLYTAWICQVLGFEWHIYEADPERLGGRLYTYWFDKNLADESGGKDKVKHDYYDIGAMRFPDTPIMSRTFKVIEDTNTAKGDYLMKDALSQQPLRYNDKTYLPYRKHASTDDFFGVSTSNGGPVPLNTVRDPDLILNDAYDRFRDKIKRAIEMKWDGNEEKEKEEDFKRRKEAASEKAWNFLLQHDRFSLRDYLTFVEGESFETTHWLETLNAGTGWFDEAFTENIMESLAFDYYGGSEEKKAKPADSLANGGEIEITRMSVAPDAVAERGKWHYIQNGSSSLVINVMRKLEDLIVNKDVKEGDPRKPVSQAQFPLVNIGKDFPNVMERISMGHRVTKIGRWEFDPARQSQAKPQDDSVHEPVVLSVVDSLTGVKRNGGEYDAVFNSTTFGALQRMDLTQLDLPYDTKFAIRSLRYDPSTKVAIRFKKAWWMNNKLPYIIKGGLGKTDMPLRTCVYPSYNLGKEGEPEEPAVLLCSYTWGADSERVASMISETKMKDRSTLKRTDQLAQVMLENLARLHTDNKQDYQALFDYINSDDVFDTYHAHDWSKDTYTCGGAFALFSPSQFSRTYPAVVKPLSKGQFYIIGEAASAHHAWVVGALDSSARAMWQMLERFHMPDKQELMEKTFTPIGEVDKETAYLQVALSFLTAKERSAAQMALPV